MFKNILVAIVLMASASSCTHDSLTTDDLTSSLDSRGSGTPVSVASIPQTVKDFISSKYPGYRIKEAQQEVEDAGIQFKVTIVNGGLKKRLLFDANWVFISEKL